MLTSRINAFDEGFVRITEQVEARVVTGLQEAAVEAAAVAQAGASIDLELEVVPTHNVVDGYSAGIKSRRESSNPGRTTPIARFFDEGTLGRRRKHLKRPRKDSWTVNRGGSTFVAHRGDVAGKGIRPERFFARARAAGLSRLLESIHRPF